MRQLRADQRARFSLAIVSFYSARRSGHGRYVRSETGTDLQASGADQTAARLRLLDGIPEQSARRAQNAAAGDGVERQTDRSGRQSDFRRRHRQRRLLRRHLRVHEPDKTEGWVERLLWLLRSGANASCIGLVPFL